MSDTRILVTGATGFVGRHVVERLGQTGRPLTLALRSATACPPSWRGKSHLRTVITGPIETADNLAEAISGVSAVIHLAGRTNVNPQEGTDGTDLFTRANTEATEKLARAAAAGGVQVFLHASSVAAVCEHTAKGIVDDSTLSSPTSAYGRSKRAAEEALSAIAAGRMLAISLRPPLICGPDAPGNWGLLQRLAATGVPLPFASTRNKRSLLGISTLADALLHICSASWPLEKAGNYCVADKGSISLAEIITELRAGMGMGPRLYPFPPSVIRVLAGLAGQGRRAAGLLGDLEVDASRFFETFRFAQSTSVMTTVRRSGGAYRQYWIAR